MLDGEMRPFQIAHVLFVSTLTVEPLLLAVKEFVLGISGFKRPPPQLEAAVDGGSRAGLPRVTEVWVRPPLREARGRCACASSDSMGQSRPHALQHHVSSTSFPLTVCSGVTVPSAPQN